VSDDRIQFDLQNLPKGVVPAIRKLAAMKGLTIGLYVRTLVVEHALTSLEKGPDAKAAHS
jgi:hypothetical protein